MSLYVSDFVTGASIGVDERAVAVVIAPKIGGWPDPVKAAAFEPIHPGDRFQPASLPLMGSIASNGFFTPDEDQLPLSIFLNFVKCGSWNEFQLLGLNDAESGIELRVFAGESRNVIFGISVMKPTTYTKLIEFWPESWRGIRPENAVADILIDARKRAENGDYKYWNLATEFSLSPVPMYKTESGNNIVVPELMHALAKGHPWELYDLFQTSILRQFQNADRDQLIELYGHLAGFQQLTYGLGRISRHYAPGNFTRHENRMDVIDFQLSALHAELKGLPEHPQLGIEMNETIIEDLSGISARLKQILENLNSEINEYRSRADLGMGK